MTFNGNDSSRRTDSSPQITKVSTGIVGLDEVLRGGFPEDSLTLLSGGPGAGKTMFGLEFLTRGAQNGHPGIMLTFEEREESLYSYAKNLNWDLRELEKQNLLSIISARIQPEAVLSGDFDLQGILGILRKKAEDMNAHRIVIDAPDVFLRLLDNVAKERAQLQILQEWLRDHSMTTVMSVKAQSGDKRFSSHSEFLDYMANCVIHLDQRVYDQIATRRLRCVKYRGSAYGRNEYPFGITDHGVWIIPITQASLQHKSYGENLSSGVAGLDKILGGGYRRSSCTLISGCSGSGKTTFACSFAVSATSKNERVLYIDFEESWDALANLMLSPGLDLKSAYESGLLRFVSNMPESQGIEEHLIQAFREIEDFKPDHIIVDAISACSRMGSRSAAFDYLLRLIDHCKQRGITAFLTNLVSTKGAAHEITGIDLSSVIDTVVILRNYELDGVYRRELGIMKSRGRNHSNKIHTFEITDDGIKINNGEENDGE